MNHKPQIIPVVSPQIDWGLFVSGLQQMLGESPTRLLDQQGVKPDSHHAFLKALGNGEYTEKQLSFSFLIEVDTLQYIEVLKRTQLKTVEFSNRRSLVILTSGTLYEWREACLEFCSEDVDIVLRYIFDYIYLYLHHLKLLTLYKTTLKDQTFILEDMR